MIQTDSKHFERNQIHAKLPYNTGLISGSNTFETLERNQIHEKLSYRAGLLVVPTHSKLSKAIEFMRN